MAQEPSSKPPPRGLIARTISSVISTLLLPLRVATSKLALKAYLTSILFFLTALTLFAIALVAYLVFYYTYIPRIGFSRPLYLQYDPISPECRSQLLAHRSNAPLDLLRTSLDGNDLAALCTAPAPWAVASVNPELFGQQAYAVTVELLMPLDPTNVEAGNFMVDAALSSPGEVPLATSRRPAVLPYRSWVMGVYHTLWALPRATFGLTTEAERLAVPLWERVSFARGQKVPTQVRVELQAPAGQRLRVYEARIRFHARLEGLRWLMYNFRFLTGAVFVGVFFVAEMGAAAVVYGILGVWLFSSGGAEVKTEREEEDVDEQRTIKAEVKVKTEPEDLGPLTPGVGGEADDEDEEDVDYILNDTGGWRDSGLGTSLESGVDKGIRRRRSRGGESGLARS